MGKLDNLKIASVPKAFLPFAQKHNMTVRLLELLQGGSGVDVQVSENRSIISLRPTAIQAIGQAGGSGGNVNGSPTLVVGPTGSFVSVYGTGSTNANYPTTLRTDGANFWIANSSGFAIVNGGNAVSIPYANVARSMTIRTINVCNGTTSALMDIIASAPY